MIYCMTPSRKRFNNTFNVYKPIIGMIHLKGTDDNDIFQRAIREINIMIEHGVDAVMIEDYFGKLSNVERVLQHLFVHYKSLTYGVNILKSYGNYEKCGYEYAFNLANAYDAKFIQIDSVAGHLDSINDIKFQGKINKLREESDAFILGGVRFKYQPVLSEAGLEIDLKTGMKRSDAIVVTGPGTGIEANLDTIKDFRNIIQGFPLIVGAGLTPANCIKQLAIADGGIVGSYFKEYHDIEGELVPEYIDDLMSHVKTLRRK